MPREHGAWVMLAMPIVLALFTGVAASPAAWLVAAAAPAAFLAHAALVPWLVRVHEGKASPPEYAVRRGVWGAAYLVTAAALFAAAVVATPARGPLLAIAAGSASLAGAYALASVFGSGRSTAAEVTGMAGMALTAAMMGAAGGRPLGRPLFGASLLALAYSLSSLSYVRAYERSAAARAPAIATCVAAHAAIVAGLVVAAVEGIVPPYACIAIAPVLARTASGLASPPKNLRALGLRELWVAAAFVVLAALAQWRTPTP